MDTVRPRNTGFTISLVFLLCLVMAHRAFAETFSIVVLPDTQFYTQDNPDIFDTQTDWIRTNQAAENIIYVAHLGDIVDSAGCNGGPTEWGNADGSMDTLDGAAAIADDIPYGVVPGNHDFDPTVPGGSSCSSNRTQYNTNFGPARYTVPGAPWYGGSQDGTTNDNNFTLFSSPEGVDFIAINLAYSNSSGPAEAATLAWADAQLKAYPNRIGIVTSHFFITDARTGGSGCELTDDLGTYGSAMWDELKDNPNLSLILSGHCRGEKWITFEGGGVERPGCLGDVHGLMSNYQAYSGEESGYMRIMRFDTVARTVDVETFSNEAGVPAATPLVDPADMDTTSVSNFSFAYDTTVSTCSDVALAMDRSGSMNGASGAIAGTKLLALQNAADLFVDQISFDERHRLAMVQFNSGLVPFAVPEIPFVTVDDSNVGVAHTMIASIVGGGSTNIINGLQGGVDKLDVMSPNERRVVVLFTDGKHNTPSVLADAALEAELNTAINSVDTDMELYSLGFGTSISDVALSASANSNGGWHVNETDPIVVAKTFSLVAARVMEDQVLSDPIYLVNPGETKSHRVGVSRADRNLTFVTHWDQFNSDHITISIEPPGGVDCTINSRSAGAGLKQAMGINYHLVRVNLPYDCNGKPAHEGEWVVHISAKKDSAQKQERVDVLAYASSDLLLSSQIAYSDGQIDIAAFLKGRPVKGAKMIAYISEPVPEKGNSTRLDELGSNPDGAALIPPLEPVTREVTGVSLEVTSHDGDSLQAKGMFNPKSKGLYQVRVVANITDATGQLITREATASVYNPKAKLSVTIIWVVLIFIVLLIIFLLWRRDK